MLPWANGRCLVWDFTCPDTLAASHLNRVVISPGLVANDTEDWKTAKYRTLAPLYSFMPIAVESLGALGDCAIDFSQKLGQRISVAIGEPRSSQFLFQKLSVAIQRGKAACSVISSYLLGGGIPPPPESQIPPRKTPKIQKTLKNV